MKNFLGQEGVTIYPQAAHNASHNSAHAAHMLRCPLAAFPRVSFKGRILLANPQCRKLCLAYAVVEGRGPWRIQRSNRGCIAWK